jgi:putative endonuclease
MAQHNDLGKLGEELAIKYLTAKGFVIRDRNWRYQKAEVDIIAQKENLLVAVEVKTRTSVDFGGPQEFVNPKKIKLLVKAMDEYITLNDLDVDFRFDIIGVVPRGLEYEIEHLEDAFLYF